MKTLSLCLVALFTLCFASQLVAITDEEIFRAFSLNLSTPGARARGMGGAFIGRADDATAAETNPAGLTILVRPEVSFEYRFSNSRKLTTNVVGIPVRSCTDPSNPATCLDLTPTPVAQPDPAADLAPVAAEFHAKDSFSEINELGFFSFVYPVKGITFAFARHQLIDTDARVSGSLTSSPFHFVEANSFDGTANIQDTNYSFSLAAKLGDMFSLGGSVKASVFDFQSSIGARQGPQSIFGEHFTSVIDTEDTKIGFNAGLLFRPMSQFSVGLVYRYEPKFDLSVTVNNVDFHPNPLIISRQGVTKVGFDVPDTAGVGVSLAPTRNWTVNLDVLRIFYSQLGPVENQYSLFTHLLPVIRDANIIQFKVDDGTDVHVGTEYLVTTARWTWAIRGGYYRESRDRFFLAFAANSDVENFLLPVFGSGPGNDLNHFTLGTGLTYGKFQVDTAIDMTRRDNVNQDVKQEAFSSGVTFILSGVYRF